MVGIYEAVLKGKLHHGCHQLTFFCVFLERVVGKLSKPLSGHNSKIHVASTAGLIFTKHSLLPAFFLYMSLCHGSCLFMGLLYGDWKSPRLYWQRVCAVGLAAEDLLIESLGLSCQVSKCSTPGFFSLRGFSIWGHVILCRGLSCALEDV